MQASYILADAPATVHASFTADEQGYILVRLHRGMVSLLIH